MSPRSISDWPFTSVWPAPAATMPLPSSVPSSPTALARRRPKSSSSSTSSASVAQPPPPAPAATPAPVVTKPRPPESEDVADRVVAVVNNDAITLGELQENIAIFRQENRGRVSASDEELQKQFLGRLIDSRLQIQEAGREKITVEDAELNEELAERMKRFGAKTPEELEALVKSQGLSYDTVKKRIRDSLLVQKVMRRKVSLRISVTEPEIDRYIADNREKLEAGLGYHARH